MTDYTGANSLIKCMCRQSGSGRCLAYSPTYLTYLLPDSLSAFFPVPKAHSHEPCLWQEPPCMDSFAMRIPDQTTASQ